MGHADGVIHQGGFRKCKIAFDWGYEFVTDTKYIKLNLLTL